MPQSDQADLRFKLEPGTAGHFAIVPATMGGIVVFPKLQRSIPATAGIASDEAMCRRWISEWIHKFAKSRVADHHHAVYKMIETRQTSARDNEHKDPSEPEKTLDVRHRASEPTA